MDELAKKLSLLSFGVIGVICLIGILQQRSWLDMFTIGGTSALLFPLVSINEFATDDMPGVFDWTCSFASSGCYS